MPKLSGKALGKDSGTFQPSAVDSPKGAAGTGKLSNVALNGLAGERKATAKRQMKGDPGYNNPRLTG